LTVINDLLRRVPAVLPHGPLEPGLAEDKAMTKPAPARIVVFISALAIFAPLELAEVALAEVALAEDRPAAGSAAVGQETYLRYCAVCHGLDGRGAGPLADALKKTPPNLTLLAKHNSGKFPATRVADTIRDGAIPGHGRKTMLEWGKVFGGDKDRLEATSLILDLTLYLETLQEK